MNAFEQLSVAAVDGEASKGQSVTGSDGVLALAREAGMTVTLDACIGREQYQSVTGSCAALERFARACRHGSARATEVTPDRTMLEQWASACDQGQSRDVARAIRAWLSEAGKASDDGHTGGRKDCGGK